MEIWEPDFLKLFISHTSKHKKFIEQLKKALLKVGISGFVAHSDIKPTKKWEEVIENALKTADALVAYLTEDFHESSWTDQEVGVAIGRGIFVISIRAGIDPYGFIGKYQGYPGAGKTADQIAEDLADILMENESTKKIMSYALVKVFEDSGSFEAAKKNMARLEEVAYWDKRLTRRLKLAVKENSQVREAFGVSDRVDRLIHKFEE